MNKDIYIGLGSNLDDPKQQIISAFDEISHLPETQLRLKSSLYLSFPMGPQDQDKYVNAVAKISSLLSPIDLLDQLQTIEQRHHRERKLQQWGPRTLDLDLLLYDNRTIDSDRLIVPHYGLKQRSFVLIPLVEIAPELRLPDGSDIQELAKKIGGQGIQKL